MDYAHDNKATVMKYTGIGTTGWEAVGSPGFSDEVASRTSLVMYHGTPYVAYTDGDRDVGVIVMKYNGSARESVGSK
jgi:hypothetical protein